MDLATFIRDIPDFPKPGVLFRDITPLLQDPQAFAATIRRLALPWAGRVDAIAALEARGFIFAAALARDMALPFVPVRKAGKLPAATYRQEYELEYGSDAIEVHQDAFKPGDRVLVVDDLLATGGTAAAACDLIEKAGAQPVGCAFVMELAELGGRRRLQGIEITALLTYGAKAALAA